MTTVPKPLEDAVEAFAQLPGVGRKTAFRYALHLLKSDEGRLTHFSEILKGLATQLKPCAECHNITESQLCPICADPARASAQICVVEDIRDLISIEATGQFKGRYHVLGGVISPMDGIGPNNLHITTLIERVNKGEVSEVILALPATMEGDTTMFYLFRQLQNSGVEVTTLARGIAVGGSLEYADELTLGRSLVNRVPYENALAK